MLILNEDQIYLLESYSQILPFIFLETDQHGNLLSSKNILSEDKDFNPLEHVEKNLSNNLEDVMDDCILSISKGNAKIDHPYISLPAGYSCPFARECLAKAEVDPETGKAKLKHGKNQKYTCYAAGEEVRYKAVRKSRWRNFDLLRMYQDDPEKMSEIIKNSIRFHVPNAKVFRIHESGDFFNINYFMAWIMVAKDMPYITFYAYTKSIKYWVQLKSQIPDNLILNASLGGINDDLILKHGLKFVTIVDSIEEATEMRLKIDVDDSLAYKQNEPFALLIHGVQKKGGEGSKMLKKAKESGSTEKIKKIKKALKYKYENGA